MAAPTAAASSSSLYFPDPYDQHHLLDRARLICADLVIVALPLAFPTATAASFAAARADIAAKFSRPTLKGRGELTLPCFIFNKKMDPALSLPPPAVAAALQPHLTAVLAAQPSGDVQRTEAAAAYINFYLSSHYLASVVPLILDGSYLAPLARTRQPKIMVEYSQPNTSASLPHHSSPNLDLTSPTPPLLCLAHPPFSLTGLISGFAVTVLVRV